MIFALTNHTTAKPADVSKSLWAVRKDLSVRNGALYKGERIFVPFKLRLRILTASHGLHRGMDATVNCLREKCFWPRCRDQCVNFVKNCRVCSFVKPRCVPTLATPVISKAPMEILAVDYIGPLPESQGYKYLLTAVDTYSRYPFVIPVRNLSAATLITKMKEIFCYCGFPDALLSVRGTQFMSNEFCDFLSDLGIKKLTTNAYHPQGNGICERFNGTIQKFIFSYLEENALTKNQWLRAIPAALLNYRTTVHKATGVRPVDIFFFIFSARIVTKIGKPIS